MTSDILKGKWKQIKGNAKTWWGKLTDDEIERIEGNRDLLLGKLQEKYGWSKAEAENEIDRRLSEFKKDHEEAA